MAPRVVCIHFSTGSDAQWRALTDGLSGRCRMLGVDLHGRAHAWPGATWDASLLAALRMAVLLMQGSQTRPSAARVAKLLQVTLPQVQAVTLTGAGRMGSLTHSDAVVREMQLHLQQVGALATPMRAAA